MRVFLTVLGLLVWGPPAAAQDAQTLADIRQELTLLKTQMQGLKSEMTPTGRASVNVSGDVLQRVDGIEAELTRLTSMTESLQHRINRVVTDGTNRIGDLEFRLVELEGGDVSQIAQTAPLGGDAGTAAPAPQQPGTQQPDTQGVELAVSEQADFERAQEALASGDFRGAADQFATFTQSYPGGPLTAQAHFLRGQSLENLGDWNLAARAYLESFSGAPNSDRAPEALYKLGVALHRLGQTSEACLMLAEVGLRFPGAREVALAETSLQSFACS